MDPERLQLIDLANKSFGESGWSFSISNVTLDFVDKNSAGHHAVGTTAVVRVQLPNGIFREDIGYGSGTGPNKSEVIYQTKMDAVTMGLRGAFSCFGRDFVRKLNSLTPSKGLTEKVGSHSNFRDDLLPKTSSPALKTRQLFIGQQNINDGQSASEVPLKPPVTTPTTSPLMVSKQNLLHTEKTPVLSKSPLAKQLHQANYSTTNQLSEEEIAKAKRKERQRLLQEEFRKKHLLEQAQEQTKAQEKAASQNDPLQLRMPLKEQQAKTHQLKETSTALNALDGDDDDFMSTQEIEKIVEIAANTTAITSNISKRTPMVSSPSIARSAVSESRIQVPHSKGQKRPDLSNFAFHPDKKSRGQQ